MVFMSSYSQSIVQRENLTFAICISVSLYSTHIFGSLFYDAISDYIASMLGRRVNDDEEQTRRNNEFKSSDREEFL
jgi:hypothetical protein